MWKGVELEVTMITEIVPLCLARISEANYIKWIIT